MSTAKRCRSFPEKNWPRKSWRKARETFEIRATFEGSPRAEGLQFLTSVQRQRREQINEAVEEKDMAEISEGMGEGISSSPFEG